MLISATRIAPAFTACSQTCSTSAAAIVSSCMAQRLLQGSIVCAIGRLNKRAKPFVHSLICSRRQLDHGDGGVDRLRMAETTVNVEIDMGQQIDLGQYQHLGGGENVGIFKRLIIPFR